MPDSCRQHPGEVVADHKHHQCIKEAIKSAEEPAQETTQTCEHPLNLIDHILHNLILSSPFGAQKTGGFSAALTKKNTPSIMNTVSQQITDTLRENQWKFIFRMLGSQILPHILQFWRSLLYCNGAGRH